MVVNMKKYTVEVTETLQRSIEVEAESENDAIEVVEQKYKDEEIVLDSSDYVSTEIDVYNEDKYTSSLDALKARIDKFNKDRNWDQFHSVGNLVKSISIEASELLECFQWNDVEYNFDDVCEELADVMNYCIQLSMVLKVDLVDIIHKKMDKNEKKYPVEKAKGVSTKYTRL